MSSRELRGALRHSMVIGVCVYSGVCVYGVCVYGVCVYTARPYESCKNIQGLAPPRCPFETGTTVVQIISNRPEWSRGNEKANQIE